MGTLARQELQDVLFFLKIFGNLLRPLELGRLRPKALSKKKKSYSHRVEYMFIQNHFHPKRENFIPKPLPSQVHFHPKYTFIPSPLSSKTIFIPYLNT